MNFLIGLLTGWITMGFGSYFFMKFWSKKMFGKTPYVRKGKMFTDDVRNGLIEKFKK